MRIVAFFVFRLAVCHILSRIYAVYDPIWLCQKYVLIENEFFSELLIPHKKESAEDKTNEVNKNKLSVAALVSYILQLVITIVFVVFQIIPEIACDPFELHYGRHSDIMLYTLNDKIPLVSIAVFSALEMAYISLSFGLDKSKEKAERMSHIALFVLFIAYAVLSML